MYPDLSPEAAMLNDRMVDTMAARGLLRNKPVETAFRSTVSVGLEGYYEQPDWWATVYQALRKGALATTVLRIGRKSHFP